MNHDEVVQPKPAVVRTVADGPIVPRVIAPTESLTAGFSGSHAIALEGAVTEFCGVPELAVRASELYRPIREAEWKQLRRFVQRAKLRERSVTPAFWSAVTTAISGLLALLGFLAFATPSPWPAYVAASVTIGSASAAVVLRIIERKNETLKSTSVDDALELMNEIEEMFLNQVRPNSR